MGFVGGGTGHELTASTRSSEVLPAFCRPIIVMSISWALEAAETASAKELQHAR